MKAATLSDPRTPLGDLLKRLDEDGYLLFPGLLTEAEVGAVKALAPAGSLLVFPGNLTHRGGANAGAPPRLAVTTQFCQGWMRQQENMMVSVGEVAKDLSPRVQALIGYSIHPPFLGQV